MTSPPPPSPARPPDTPASTASPPAPRGSGGSLRRLLVWSLAFLLLWPLLLVTAWFALRWEPLQQRVWQQLESRPELSGIHIEGIAGNPFQELTVRLLEFRDREGRWLTIEQARATLSPGSLLQGRLHFQNFQAERVQALRPPQEEPVAAGSPPPPDAPPDHAAQKTTAETAAETTASGSAGMGFLLTHLVLDPARITRLELGEALLLALPPAWRDRVAVSSARAEVSIDLQRERIAITGLSATSRAATLTGALELDLLRQSLAGKFHGSLPDLTPFALVGTPHPLIGALSAEVTLSGSLTAPRTDLTLTSPALAWNGHRAEGMVVTARIQPPAADSGARPWPEGVSVTAQGRADALHLPELGPEWPALQPVWHFAGHFPNAGTLTVARLAIDNGALGSGEAQGTIRLDSLSGPLTVTVRSPELKSLARLLPWPLSGGGEARLELHWSDDGTPMPFTLQAEGQNISGLPAGLAGLIGTTPKARLKGLLRRSEGLEAESVELKGARFDLEGSGRVNWADGTIQAKTGLQLSDLSALSGWSGQPLSGSARMNGTVQGSWSALRIGMQGESDHLRVNGHPFKRVTVRGELSDPWRSPSGTVELALTQPQGILTATTRYRLENHHTRLYLDGLRVNGPRSRLTGDLVADWQQARIAGKLKGELEDLAALKGWHGQELGGRVELDLDLENTPSGTPRGHVRGQVKALSGQFGRLERLNIDARIGVERGKPSVDAELEVNRWQQGENRLDGIKGRASGTPEQLQFSGEGRGTLKWPYTFALKGQASRKGSRGQLELNAFTGRWNQEGIKLTRPLTLTSGDRGWELSPWEATVGESVLQGFWKREARRVDGALKLRGELALLNRLGIWPIRGAAALELMVSGHEDRPEVTATATLTRGQALGPDYQHLPPLNLRLQGTAREGRQPALALTAQGFTPEAAQAQAVLPLRLFARPPWVERDPDGTLSGETRADIPLNELGKWLGLEEQQRLEGLLKVDLTATGTLDHPAIRGHATLERGRFELADSGTALHDIRLRIAATGDALLLESFEATDGEKGTLKGEGRLQLAPETHFPVELTLRLAQAVMLRREEAMAIASGPLRVTGTLTTPKLQGELTIHRAEFHPPSGGVEEIAVVELDEPHPEAEQQKAAAPPFAKSLLLDLSLLFPARTYVQGHGLDSEWMGDLRVTGSASEPLITGQLRVKRGNLDLLERRFQLSSGALSFDGSWPPTPWIEMEAVVRRGEIATHVGLEGSLLRPKVKLTSDPVMSEEEILSHLLFDRATDSITPGQALKLALALKSMQGGGPGFLGSVQKELGIDRLDLGGDSVESGTVSAGKYLTDTIYLEVEKGLKADSGRINVEVEMTPRLYLKTGVDAKSNGDVGVQWKKDY
ncbi:MAG: translocation/assembly module TamB domain-containing protein [Magnetococcales bacterium]|nr:translocation/assembly module TamB domain-containing protein [Magnetococcales bacterium]